MPERPPDRPDVASSAYVSSDDKEGDFFVAYFPMSASTRRFLVATGVVLAIAVLTLSWGLSRSQPVAVGDVSPYRTGNDMVGYYIERPYPHLLTLDDSGQIRTILLVSRSKHAYDGDAGDRPARVRGNLIERSGLKMMEVQSLESAPDLAVDPRLRPVEGAAEEAEESVTFTGEIVDSKCYLGRMRPGSGRAHRACAQLCIAGGVPPIFVRRMADGKERVYVLCSSDELPVNELVLPFVAEPVEVVGDLVRRADLNLLRIDPARIRRL